MKLFSRAPIYLNSAAIFGLSLLTKFVAASDDLSSGYINMDRKIVQPLMIAATVGACALFLGVACCIGSHLRNRPEPIEEHRRLAGSEDDARLDMRG